MPMLNLGNLPVEHMTPSYSSEALERAFTILKVIYLKEKQYAIAIKKSLSLGVIVKVEPSEKGRHNVVASVEFETLEVDNHQALAASEYWQDNGFLQVKGVGVDDPLQDEGLAATLYETVATKKDVYIVSDNEQFRPGKALWRKIARESKLLSVFVLNQDTLEFYPFDGTDSKLQYDGKSIPEDSIWSNKPNQSKFKVVLVGELK